MSVELVTLGFLMSGPKSGYKLQSIANKMMLFYNISLNQVYPALRKLEKAGHVQKELVIQTGKPNKNVFTITDSGREHFMALLTGPPEPLDVCFPFLVRSLFFGFSTPKIRLTNWKKRSFPWKANWPNWNGFPGMLKPRPTNTAISYIGPRFTWFVRCWIFTGMKYRKDKTNKEEQMPEPQYPTKEGLWSEGTRPEKAYSRVKLGLPYAKAVESLRGAYRDRDDFDPAVLFVWGTMQATGMLNILKAVEAEFGPKGQDVVRGAINEAGYEACQQMLENSEFPEDVPEMELASYIITGVNTVLYASLEKPWVETESRCEFDILWCPHQDRYSAFDCRVQRYFVEGMIRAIEDAGYESFVPLVTQLIPRGADKCHFVVDRRDDDDDTHPWDQYSEELGRRAFAKLKGKE